MSTEDKVRVPEASLRATVTAIFEKLGETAEDAALGADTLLDADLRGIEMQGVTLLLPIQVQRYKDGWIKPRAEWKIVRETPGTATIDSDHGLVWILGSKYMQLAVEKARNVGVGVVTAFGGGDSGRIGHYARKAIEHDMVGMVTSCQRDGRWQTEETSHDRLQTPARVAGAVGRRRGRARLPALPPGRHRHLHEPRVPAGPADGVQRDPPADRGGYRRGGGEPLPRPARAHLLRLHRRQLHARTRLGPRAGRAHLARGGRHPGDHHLGRIDRGHERPRPQDGVHGDSLSRGAERGRETLPRNEVERHYFAASGIDIVGHTRFDCRMGWEIPAIAPERIVEQAMAHRDAIEAAGALFLTCTNLRSMEVAQDLERALDVPVVTSNSATLWAALVGLGVDASEVRAGRLFGSAPVADISRVA